MKEAIQLKIAQPCHENWQAMTPVEQGRHCGSCAKNVVDFTIMSDREIIDYISLHAGGDTCGRVNNDQLSRVIQKPGERSVSWKYFWSIALSSLLLSYRAVAQQPSKNKIVFKTSSQVKEDMPVMLGFMAAEVVRAPEYKIRGRVANEDGEPVPYASLILKEPYRLVVADSVGRFTIPAQKMNAFELSASAAGYQSHEPFVFTSDPPAKSIDLHNRQVVMEVGDLELKKTVLPEVVVIGYPTMGKMRITTGSMSYVRADTFSTHVDTIVNKIQKTINKITGRSEIKNSGDVKVYPNPAPANGSFFVQFNIKEAGEYNVQFIDALGRIVAGKPLVIAAPGQVEAFPAASLQGHGMYFIRVAGAKDGKLYNARLEIL